MSQQEIQRGEPNYINTIQGDKEVLISKCKTTPSPPDERDWNAGNIYKKNIINPILDLRDDLPPIRDQGNQGTCAAQTATCMKEWQEKQDYNFTEYMSPQFIYNNRVNQQTEGMYGRDVMRILSKIGSIEETIYRYGKIESVNSINKELYTRALSHKIKNYARINDIDNLKKALSINGPCYIAFPAYNSGVKMWKKTETDTEEVGGHAMTVVGYNNEGFIIRNTWGKEWGDKGYCIYPYSDWGSHWEIWTTIDEKSYLPDIEDNEQSEDTKTDNDKDNTDNDNDNNDDNTDNENETDNDISESLCSKILKLLGLNI